MKKWSRIILCVALMFQAIGVMIEVPKVEAAVSTLKQIEFKVGSDQAIVNGAKQKIVKPYLADGSVTMVPYSLLKAGFGLKLQWIEPKKYFKITGGNRFISMQINETRMSMNRAFTDALAAPKLVGSELMVPLRTVAEGLDAAVSVKNGFTKVQWDTKRATDEMSTRVGCKQCGWSMYLPKENWQFYIHEEKGKYSFTNTEQYRNQVISLEVDDGYPAGMKAEELMDLLIRYFGERYTYQDGVVGEIDGTPYAQAILTDENGVERAARIVSSKDKLYTFLVSGVKVSEIQGMLNSFRPAYVLSGVPNNMVDAKARKERLFVNDEYGVQMTIPAAWSIDEYQSMTQSSADGLSAIFWIQDAEGLTAEEVAKKRILIMEKTAAPGSLEFVTRQPYKLSGGQTGYVLQMIRNLGNGKFTQYELNVVDHEYAYTLKLIDEISESGKSESLDKVLATVSVNASKVNAKLGQFGFMKAWDDVQNVEVEGGRISFDVPASWTDLSEHEADVFFETALSDHFGFLRVKDSKLADMKKYSEELNEADEYMADSKMVQDENKTINKQDVRILRYEHMYNDFPAVLHLVYIKQGQDVVVFYMRGLKASYSSQAEQQFMKVIESMTVHK